MSEPPGGWSAPGEPSPSNGESVQPSYGGSVPPPAGYGPAGQGQPQWGQQWGQPAGQWGQQQWGQQQWGQQSWGAPPPPTPGVVPLRPLGLGELLDGAIKIIRRYPRPTLGLSAVIAIASTLVNLIFVWAVYSPPTLSSTDDPAAQFDEQFTSGVAVQGPGAIVGYLAGLVLTGALVVVVGKAVLGKPVSMSEVWQTVRPRLWALLGLSLLTGLIVGGPVILAVVVLVLLVVSGSGGAIALGVLLLLATIALFWYFWVRFSLAAPVLVLERTGIRTALSRSSLLVRGSWWRIFGILLLTGIISSVLGGIISAPVAIAGAVLGKTETLTFVLLTQVAAGLASVLVSPFSAGVRALLYVDRRMRAEGLDVSLQAAAAAPSA